MQRSRSRVPAALAALALAIVLSPARAQDLASFEKHLSQRTLDNGLTLLVYERPEAPVVSFFRTMKEDERVLCSRVWKERKNVSVQV